MLLSEHPICRVVAEHARAVGRTIGKKVVYDLKRMSKPLMSGDDSGLTSVWLEICVQFQGEESYFWDAYLQLMHDVALSRLQAVSPPEQEMLWLQTEPGWSWMWDVINRDGDEATPPHPGMDDDVIARWIIQEFVKPAAEAAEHRLIDRFFQMR